MSGKFCFAIDRGGTFTDVMCICPNGKVRTLKLLSVDPQRYDDAPREGIRRILTEVHKYTEQKYIYIHKNFHKHKNIWTKMDYKHIMPPIFKYFLFFQKPK